jgi:hypothetical protein
MGTTRAVPDARTAARCGAPVSGYAGRCRTERSFCGARAAGQVGKRSALLHVSGFDIRLKAGGELGGLWCPSGPGRTRGALGAGAYGQPLPDAGGQAVSCPRPSRKMITKCR